MHSRLRWIALAAGLALLAPGLAASADQSSSSQSASDYHPLDLVAAVPPGPGPGCDAEGKYVVTPPRRLPQSALDDPKAVRWPTLDASEWNRLKDRYVIK
jgi:hypothetical protein